MYLCGYVREFKCCRDRKEDDSLEFNQVFVSHCVCVMAPELCSLPEQLAPESSLQPH